jgi:hypothetical protein
MAILSHSLPAIAIRELEQREKLEFAPVLLPPHTIAPAI